MTLTLGSARIVLVEHDRMVAAHLIRLLARHGYTVAPVATGHDALALLRQAPTPPKLILLSLESSRLHGVDFRREQLRDPTLRAIPVVFITAEPLAPREAADLAITFYLRKPIQARQLLLVVESYCYPDD